MESVFRSGARCPLCQGAPDRVVFPFVTHWNGKAFRWVGCRDCGTHFIDPPLSEGEVADLYTPEAYHERFYPEPEPSAFYTDLASLLREHAGQRKTLLDFGCGSGPFLLAASRAGFDVHGVELHPDTIARAASITGLPVSDLDSLIAEGRRFDIVNACAVVVNLTSPFETLQKLKGLLAPGGMVSLVLSLEANPSLVYYSVSGLKRLRRALGVDRPGTAPPYHLFHTNQRAFDRFLRQRLGLRPVYSRVSENGWPFLTGGPVSRSPAALVKRAIGHAAVAAGRLTENTPAPLGNTLTAIYAALPPPPLGPRAAPSITAGLRTQALLSAPFASGPLAR